MNTPDFFKRSELTGALWAFRPPAVGALPTTSTAVWPPPAAPGTTRAPLATAPAAPPAVAPVLELPFPSASAPVVVKPRAVAGKAARVPHPPTLPVVSSLPTLPIRPSTSKSLTGDENPFDRRH